MWFLASEVVPVSRPQHSDLQGEDNRGNSSDEIEDCLNELEIHDEDMYVNLKYTSHVFNYHSERHLYTRNTCTHTTHVHTQHMYTQYMYTQYMYIQYMYTHNTCTRNTCTHTKHVHTQYMYTHITNLLVRTFNYSCM